MTGSPKAGLTNGFSAVVEGEMFCLIGFEDVVSAH